MKISITIYARNREKDIFDSFESVIEAVKHFEKIEFELILVDDQSTDKTYELMKSLSPNTFKTLGGHGINNAIFTGLEQSSGDVYLPIPGHDMFKKDAIIDLINSIEKNAIVIGVRRNLYKSRPKIKYVSSRILLSTYKFITKLDVKDVHGLVAYPTELLRKIDRSKVGHGFHMIPITLGVKNSYNLIQIPISMNDQHIKREGMKLRDYYPSFASVRDVIRQLNYLRKISKE
ncbi:MAG: hypothetical protein RL129_93 [Actinomycetota bacterium]|jgi:glycosyltransferase involved in cell wall biosynthesis